MDLKEKKQKMRNLSHKRDQLILELWNVFQDMSGTVQIEEIETEDYDMWTQCTKHSAIQKRLDKN